MKKIFTLVLLLAILAGLAVWKVPGLYRDVSYYWTEHTEAEETIKAFADEHGIRYSAYPQKLIDLLEQSPVLPAAKDEDALRRALKCESRAVFLLGGDLLTIGQWVAMTHEAGKQAVVHLDLVAGLAPKEVAVDWLRQQGADGIISTRPHLIRRGRELKMLTVLRVFAIDSKAVGNLQKETEMVTPDVIEILPGTLPKVIEKLSKNLSIPLIAGGLMADKGDILSALQAGSMCVSTSDESLWEV